MIAGRLRYRVTLLEPVRSEQGRYGAESVEYRETVTVAAERVKLSGRRVEEVGEHFGEYKVEYNIRWAHQVDEHWRVREIGGHLYEVIAVLPNLTKGYKTLVCERVNE